MQTIIVGLLLVVALSVVFSILSKRINRLESELAKSLDHNLQLKNELDALLDGAIGVGDRVQKIESGLKQKEHREYREPGEISVKQAIELARKGADVDELVAICGLSRGEAELLATIHKAN